MDNRNNLTDLINQTKKALLPSQLLCQILKKFDAILTLLNTSIGNTAGYELGVMSDTARNPGKIYLKDTPKGLQYEIIGLDGKPKNNIISWNILPTDFPKSLPTILQSKEQYLSTLLDHTAKAGHTHTEYEKIEKAVIEQISNVFHGMYKSDKKKTLSNLKDIQEAILLFKENLKNFAPLAKTEPQSAFKLNIPVLDKLTYSSNLLVSQMHRIIQGLHNVEELIKKNYADATGYELACMTLQEDSVIDHDEVKEMIKAASEKQGHMPVLIKQGENIYIFGNKSKKGLKWEMTELDPNKIDHSLFPDIDNQVKIKEINEIKEDIYKEIKEKKAHIQSHLSKKIETYKLIVVSLSNDIWAFNQGVQFYKNNISAIRSNYSKASKILINADQEIQLLQKLINDNEQTLTQTQAMFAESKSYLETICTVLQAAKQQLTHLPDALLVEQDIRSLEQLLKKTEVQLEILTGGLETNIKHIYTIKEEFADYTNKLNTLSISFQTYSRLIMDKSSSAEFENDIVSIAQTTGKIALIGRDIDQSVKSIDTLKSTANANLISINQHLMLAKELQLKMVRFLAQANSLEQQLIYRATNKKPSLVNSNGVSQQELAKPSTKRSATIEPADNTYLSTPISLNKKSSTFSDEKKMTDITQAQSQEVIYFLKNQIKNHPWSIHIGGKQSVLIENASRRPGSKKATLNSLKLTTTTHANKMLRVVNELEISKVNNPNTSKNYITAVNDIDKITQHALKTHSFFRTHSTEIAYRHIQHDIHEVKQLSRQKQPDHLLAFTQEMINKLPASIHLIEFATKCQEIYSTDMAPSDKLIQLYLTTKDYLYNKSLTDVEKKQLHQIIFSLSQVNVAATLQNIKDEIKDRCRNKQWSVYLGGETITIDHIQYKVPAHVKKIWDTMEPTSSNDHSDSELESFSRNLNETDQSARTLSKIICISEKAALHSHCTRHHTTQAFYMNIVASKTFLQYHHEPSSIHHSDYHV